jgi:VanZ family protein
LDVPAIKLVAKVVGWLLLAFIILLTLSPASYRPVTKIGHSREHYLVHFVLGVTFGIGYAREWWLVALGLVGLTAVAEFAQLFVPGRHARLKDFVIDAGAVCLGVAIVWGANVAAAKPS